MAIVDDLDRDFSAFRRTGDATALARVFDAAAPRLLLVASHWTQDACEVEDLVQVAFVQAVRDAAQWDDRRPVLRWLAGIVAHRALDRRRQRQSELPTEATALDGFAAPTPSPLAAAIDGEQLDRITQALARLEPPYHEVLVLRVVHGLQPTAIAHALGRAPATVRKQLERGLQQLRGLLPAALASAFVMLLPGRGLAAVRAQVLARLPRTALPSSLGALLMKKTLAALSLLLVLTAVIAWQLVPMPTAAPVQTPPMPVPVAVAAAHAAPAQPENSREPVARPIAASAAGTEATLQIRVVAAVDGAPIAGMPVQLLPHDGSDERTCRRFASTDAAGSATFEHLATGIVVATLPTLGANERARLSVVAGDRSEHVFPIAGVRVVAGMVVDTNGRPVVGAQVRVRPRSGSVAGEQDHVAADSRDDGTFSLTIGAQVVELAATHVDHARSEAVAVAAGMPTSGLRLVLRDAPVRLRGNVHCDGRVVEGARITVAPPRDQRQDGAFWRSDGGHAFATSGADGSFVVDGLPAGDEATLSVLARGMVPFTTTVSLARGDRDVAVVLSHGPRVKGQVRCNTGEPLGGAHVRCGDGIAHCDENGRFVLDTLGPGAVTLVAGGVPKFAGSQRELHLGAGETVEVAFVLEPLSLLRGRVVDEGGRALADLVVTAYRQGQGIDFFRVEIDAQGRVDDVHGRADVTGADGTFTIPVLPAVPYVLTVQQQGQWFTTGVEGLGPYEAPQQDLVLTVPQAGLATGFVRGRLLGANGRPLAGAVLQLGDGKRLASVGRNVAGPLGVPEDGTFTIGPVPARQYTLHVFGVDDTRARFTTPPFVVAADSTLELGDVQAPAPATLQLTVRADGELPSRPLLQCQRRDGDHEVHTFDERNATTVRLVPGDYTVTVYGEGIVSQQFEVSLAANTTQRRELLLAIGVAFPIDLALPEAEQVGTVTIRGPDGATALTAEIARDEPGGCRWCPQLQVGANTAVLVCGNGHRYVANFTVDGRKRSRDEAMQLPWVRQP